MSLYIPPVTNLEQLSKYNKLGDSETSVAVTASAYKPVSNVETEKLKPDPTNSATSTKKAIDWGLYNIKAEHIQTQHIGSNIDKAA